MLRLEPATFGSQAMLAQTALTHTSRPYCVLTTTEDAAQSPWTQQGRSEVVARNPRMHNVADRRSSIGVRTP